MRLQGIFHLAAVAGAAVAFLSACSGGPESSGAGLLANIRPVEQSKTLRTVYVSDVGHAAVEILQYNLWTNLGSISSGIVTPWGNWVDKAGNLYVADKGASEVFEYSSSGTLITTYSASLSTPRGVTTDRYGNVYVTDANGVHEFSQGHNLPFSCSMVTGANGVAVNRSGDVFASVGFGVVEYPHGLFSSGCQDTVLNSSFGEAAGIALDTQGNLVVCDQDAQRVDILAPPYSSITSTLGSGWSEPLFVTIDRAGTRAYVTDVIADVVQVLNYPSGSVIATLGAANGLSAPFSAVDSKNYVP